MFSVLTEPVLDALDAALRWRAPSAGLIVHADRGREDSSHAVQQRILLVGAQGSMSRTGNPYDNAFAESLFSTIKREEVHQQTYHSLQAVQQRLAGFIQAYTTQRLHSSLGYLSPLEYEAAFWAAHGLSLFGLVCVLGFISKR